MSTSYVPTLPSEIHFNIKYNMTWNLLISHWCGCTLVQYLKRWIDGVHLFLQCVLPKLCTCFEINLQGSFNCFR